jgi:adenosylcobalamin-dependent ribonucleoside-triphosphate reductase
VERVVDGNLGLADSRHQLDGERDELIAMMTDFKIIPAGRHLWASGVKGRQYLFNCHVSGWDVDPSEHFRFAFLRLMEGGGVGANYSNKYLRQYGPFAGEFRVHIVCDPGHPDYEKMLTAGVLSPEFDSDWPGAFQVEDSREGWADALTDLIRTYYAGAQHDDRVYDVSNVRAEGSRLKTFGGRASGPLPLGRMLVEVSHVMNRPTHGFLTGIEAMEIDHAVAQCVVSGGNRRSARMAIMRWDDPQIHEFINIKANGGHWTTNISVEVDTEFWRMVEDDKASGFRSLASEVMDAMTEGMIHNGEPGFWNSDLSNVGEPNEIIATNPCGEIPLEPWENCNLGHVNLAAFVGDDGMVDHAEMERAHELITRFLIRATYGDVTDDKQAAVLARNRRIGVGHLGVASYLAKTGRRYSETPNDWYFRTQLKMLALTVEAAAKTYAHALRIPVPVKTRTVAPTGTIAKLPGVSEGVHPIFAKYFIRRIRFSDVDEDQRATVEKYARTGHVTGPCLYAPETTVVEIPTMDSLMAEVVELFGEDMAETIVQSAADISIRDMLNFQAMYQTYWADNAVSYTVNVDAGKYQPGELADILTEYGPVLKGATIFPEMSMPQSPYERLTKDEYEALSFGLPGSISDSIDENCVNGCPVK